MNKNAFVIILFVIAGTFTVLLVSNISNTPSPSKQRQANEETASPTPTGQPDFIKTGTLLNFNAETGETTGNWEFLYEEPGKPALRVNLEFTQESTCIVSDETVSCKEPELENGTRVTIEGMSQEDTVKVITLTASPQEKQVSWEEAQNLIKACKVIQVYQTHSLNVTLVLQDGTSVKTMEPIIDEVIDLVENISCTNPPLIATE